MKIPIECIESILDNLDTKTRVRDLVALLTVNRAFFHASVKRLYANPIQVLSRFDQSPTGGNGRMRYQAAHRLLILVIRYSPVQDPDVQSLRFCLSTELKALPEKPTVDYLSLIKTLHYNERCFGHESTKALGSSLGLIEMPLCIDKGLHNVLMLAACGHRLSDMLDVEILWDDLDGYHRCIDSMTSMRSIRLNIPVAPFSGVSQRTAAERDAACRVLNAVLRFMEKWSKAYGKLRESRQRSNVDIQLTIDGDGDPGWWALDPCSNMLQKVFGLMPMSTPTEISSQNALEWARFYLSPETIDVSCVRRFFASGSSKWLDGRHGWPKQVDSATIFQRFRSLQRLRVTTGARIDDDLFQWAYNERRQTATAPKSSARSDFLVPLSELFLTFYDVVHWQSAIYGFGATLTTVKVEARGGNRVDLCLIRDMPNLRDLNLSIDYIDDSGSATPFSGCPRLEVLNIICKHDNHQAFDPWDLSSVRRLTLRESLCFRFHQATLKTMNKLNNLCFIMKKSAAAFAWDMVLWKRASFPELRELHLSGKPVHTFAWQMLDQCPALQHLRLGAYGYVQERLELDPQRWPWPLTPRPTLQELYLTGFAIAYQPYVDGLPQVVPNVTSIELIDCVDIGRSGSSSHG